MFKTKDITAELKDVQSERRVVEGYFSAFDNKDSDGDIIKPGAFAKTIAEQGPASKQPRIKHILNHDISLPLGKLVELKEDSHGLYYRSELGTNNAAKDFLEMALSGLITEHSIGYWPIKQRTVSDANEISEVMLLEGSSLTAWGANPYTPLNGIKGMDKPRLAEKMQKRMVSLEKFVRNASVTDETIELLMIEIKQLSAYLLELNTPAAEKAQEPEEEESTEIEALLQKIASINYI